MDPRDVLRTPPPREPRHQETSPANDLASLRRSRQKGFDTIKREDLINRLWFRIYSNIHDKEI